MMALPVLADIEIEKTLADKGLMDLLWDADPVVKGVILILIFFSIYSWTIIFSKLAQLWKAEKSSKYFWKAFATAKTLDELHTSFERDQGPLIEIFSIGYAALSRLRKAGRNLKTGRDYLQQRLTEAREDQMTSLEHQTSFLATTASTAPFIGLFGTVWGILMAFWSISKAGSSSLATVGPHISEALIATAIGLAAAIPAVVAYNYFVRRIRLLVKTIDLFINDFLIRVDEEGL